MQYIGTGRGRRKTRNEPPLLPRTFVKAKIHTKEKKEIYQILIINKLKMFLKVIILS
jgi:hypothetical protein